MERRKKRRYYTNRTLYKVSLLFIIGLITLVLHACKKDTYLVPPPPPPPVLPQATSDLEAKFVTTAPTSVNSSYWSSANYREIKDSSISIGQTYTIGNYTLPNMNGTVNGSKSFNGGVDPKITLRAAYDNTNLYILAEWTDARLDLSNKSWLWRGPALVSNISSGDTTTGWISQKNSDRLAFAFQIAGDSAYSASANATSFTKSGCATSCHVNGTNSGMYPDGGAVDIWEWSMATSAMGYASDKIANSSGLNFDAGTLPYIRNAAGAATDTSGPKYEWNGTLQTITLPNGSSTTLNPAYYLLAKDTTPLTGNPRNGDSLFHAVLSGGYGQCNTCHGEYGESNQYMQLNNDINVYTNSRSQLVSNLGSITEMQPYWPYQANYQNDLITYIKGIAGGIPGNMLQTPSGSNADIQSYNNVTPTEITGSFVTKTAVTYKILIIRKLNTGNPDDAVFTPSTKKSYKFGVALMDNDSKNHIGSVVETLTFK